MSQQQRAAALLRQAADLLNVNTCDRSTQYQHLHQNSGSVSTGPLHRGVIRFLVTTNDHLLKELEVTRERHQHKGESD
ncbi:hypothetical protein DPMN_154515 [Dreissena polymorpha]|uniref:Uncharacterized protein n=1 Tax=Dreissena polymorpha TaxID=45954 RepID=A0A9D4JAG1_DREPO|nr:hypothetical protein DPMN_154515 [Dreissena polymorpha]